MFLSRVYVNDLYQVPLFAGKVDEACACTCVIWLYMWIWASLKRRALHGLAKTSCNNRRQCHESASVSLVLKISSFVKRSNQLPAGGVRATSSSENTQGTYITRISRLRLNDYADNEGPGKLSLQSTHTGQTTGSKWTTTHHINYNPWQWYGRQTPSKMFPKKYPQNSTTRPSNLILWLNWNKIDKYFTIRNKGTPHFTFIRWAQKAYTHAFKQRRLS